MDTSPKSLPPIRDLFSESWNIFTKNIYHFFVISIISLVVYLVIGVILIAALFATGIGGAIVSRGVQNVLVIPGVVTILGVVCLVAFVCFLLVGFAISTAYIFNCCR